MNGSTPFRRILAIPILVFASCQTNVAIFDATFGYEKELDGRAARVYASRAPIEPETEPAPTEIVVVVPKDENTPGSPSDPGLVYHRFELRLKLHNDGQAPWEFGVNNLRFSFTDSVTEVCTDCEPAAGEPLITVPVKSIGEVRVPVVLALPEGVTMRDAERYWLDMKVLGTAGGAEVTHRRLILGTYNQGWQVLRFGAVLTLVLVLGAT